MASNEQEQARVRERETAIDALESRLDAYDYDGAIGPACKDIASLLTGRREEIAAVFLDMVARSSGKPLPASRYQRQILESSDYIDRKFSDPFGRDWLRMSMRNASIFLKFGIPVHAFLQALTIAQSRLLSVLHEQLGEDSARLLRLCDVTQRLGMLEAAVVVDHIGIERDRDARDAREQRSRDFRNDIGSTIDHAADLGSRIRVQAQTASHAAGGMLDKASEMAAAAEQSAVAMREAAHTAAGLIRAIEAARNEVEGASHIAGRASHEATSAVARSQALNDHAKSIESILGLIREIAGQTNLLALNATIEAARAGDAGRGFAVVAQEVKSLANQTARATDDIAAQVAAIQEDIRSTVQINASVSATVGEVHESAGRIRGAMEMQADTVTTITAAVDETALAADSMSHTIAALRADIASVTGDVTALSSETANVDEGLARLKMLAERFARSQDS